MVHSAETPRQVAGPKGTPPTSPNRPCTRHVPTKDDLAYWRADVCEDELLASIRDHADSEPVIAAFVEPWWPHTP